MCHIEVVMSLRGWARSLDSKTGTRSLQQCECEVQYEVDELESEASWREWQQSSRGWEKETQKRVAALHVESAPRLHWSRLVLVLCPRVAAFLRMK
jgi:hypothetical protein